MSSRPRWSEVDVSLPAKWNAFVSAARGLAFIRIEATLLCRLRFAVTAMHVSSCSGDGNVD